MQAPYPDENHCRCGPRAERRWAKVNAAPQRPTREGVGVTLWLTAERKRSWGQA